MDRAKRRRRRDQDEAPWLGVLAAASPAGDIDEGVENIAVERGRLEVAVLPRPAQRPQEVGWRLRFGRHPGIIARAGVLRWGTGSRPGAQPPSASTSAAVADVSRDAASR